MLFSRCGEPYGEKLLLFSKPWEDKSGEIRRLCEERFPHCYGSDGMAWVRLHAELQMMERTGAAAHFRVACRMQEAAAEQQSFLSFGSEAAGSILSYLLGLSQCDPMDKVPPETVWGEGETLHVPFFGFYAAPTFCENILYRLQQELADVRCEETVFYSIGVYPDTELEKADRRCRDLGLTPPESSGYDRDILRTALRELMKTEEKNREYLPTAPENIGSFSELLGDMAILLGSFTEAPCYCFREDLYGKEKPKGIRHLWTYPSVYALAERLCYVAWCRREDRENKGALWQLYK